MTPGFELPASWVIHTVGPVWRGGHEGEAALLRRCYRNAFALAANRGVRSIAFPAISTGVYGYPKREAATIALEEMHKVKEDFERIVACCYSAGDASLYRELCPDCGGESA